MFEHIQSHACSCGKEQTFTSNIILERGAINHLPTLLKEENEHHAFIIADQNTYIAAGKCIVDLLVENNVSCNTYIFKEEFVEPDESNVGRVIMNFNPACDVVIAVGSGVINDIGKIIANVSDKPYIIVATAPSMDGYASATSSMTLNGLKTSLNSKCADVIIGDLDILCNAPIKMMLAGLGDMLAKYISICEWRISHLITGEYYCEDIAGLVRDSLQKCVNNASGLLNREEESVTAVFKGLVVCGAAMKFAGLSRPASGIEHYFSHIWDMRGVEFHTPVELHGLQCGVGTLLSLSLYEKMKQITPNKKKALRYTREFDFNTWSGTLRDFLGKGAESMIRAEEQEQKYGLSKHEERLALILEKWDDILHIIEEELPDLAELEKLFDKLGLPKTMAEIGIEENILATTFKATKDIRDKYVLSRLCWDLGIIDEMFS